ncbi:hypothetical protein BD289DRAFT_430909 [Coniella lustricola]|uniref:Uncharacterized protein n=1 Tax=Coniella lustricola TaxID=2025994 RepID=A0A2T3AB57_9PEZI|nr:hypothetical protein BD289DRAFT_430909 [Coniella lustricola]
MPQGATGPLTSGPITGPFMPIAVQQPYHPGPMIGRNPAAAPAFLQHPATIMMPGHAGMPSVAPGTPVPPMMMPGGHGVMMPGAFPGHQPGLLTGSLQHREMNEPQDFRPADEDPARMYWVRQLDGHYVSMPRATIDAFGDEGARWYVTDDGVFYAVRLDG